MKSTIKKALTVRVNPLLLHKIKNIVYWNPGMTMSGFVEMTLEEVTKQFEDVEDRPHENLTAGRKI